MQQRFLQFIKSQSHYTKLVAFVLLGVLVGILLGTSIKALFPLPTATAPSSQESTIPSTNDVAEPSRLRIPAVGIDAGFEGPLGLNQDETIEVPVSYEELGWYQYAPLPGDLGPAVILGHVDSYQGPAVFYDLRRTKPGDIIEIERVDGSVGQFEITELVTSQQSDFPTELVYGNIDHAGLRLVTCSGTYDHGKQVYSHNLIVFAKLVEELPAPVEVRP